MVGRIHRGDTSYERDDGAALPCLWHSSQDARWGREVRARLWRRPACGHSPWGSNTLCKCPAARGCPDRLNTRVLVLARAQDRHRELARACRPIESVGRWNQPIRASSRPARALCLSTARRASSIPANSAVSVLGPRSTSLLPQCELKRCEQAHGANRVSTKRLTANVQPLSICRKARKPTTRRNARQNDKW